MQQPLCQQVVDLQTDYTCTKKRRLDVEHDHQYLCETKTEGYQFVYTWLGDMHQQYIPWHFIMYLFILQHKH